MGWDFKDKNDAIALERLAKRERSKPNKTESVEFPERLQNTLRAIVAVPLAEIPAATFASGKIVLGKGDAYIYNRDQNDPDNLIQHLDEEGNGVIEVIYNLCDQAFTTTGSGSGTLPDLGDAVFCTQDLDGDYYITLRCDQFDGSGGGSGSGSGTGGGTKQQTAPDLSISATDEGLVAGNPRGAHSTDLQTIRNYNYQVASGSYSVICGGLANEASNSHSIAVGGLQNKSRAQYSVSVGGRGNYLSGSVSFIANGYYNNATNNFATVINGKYSTASGSYTFIGNGKSNSTNGNYGIILNGKYNTAGNYSNYTAIINGRTNRAYSSYGTILNGFNNTIYSFATNGFISNGRYNRITAGYGTILSGAGCYVYGTHGVAIGRYATVGGYHSMQLGSGFVSESYTVNIGSAGLRFKMTSGSPGSLQNGDFWVSNNYVYVYSNFNTIKMVACP